MFPGARHLGEALGLLPERQRKIADRTVSFEQAPWHVLRMGVDPALAHTLAHTLALIRADHAWLELALAWPEALAATQRQG